MSLLTSLATGRIHRLMTVSVDWTVFAEWISYWWYFFSKCRRYLSHLVLTAPLTSVFWLVQLTYTHTIHKHTIKEGSKKMQLQLFWLKLKVVFPFLQMSPWHEETIRKHESYRFEPPTLAGRICVEKWLIFYSLFLIYSSTLYLLFIYCTSFA